MRDTARERERERERQTDRQTDRQRRRERGVCAKGREECVRKRREREECEIKGEREE